MARTELFPEIEPFSSFGHITVGAGHDISVRQFGNLRGKPIVFVHGGPGYHCTEKDARYFDPDKWRIILIDQRGCGKSISDVGLERNETPYLVLDMQRVLTALGIPQVAIFGGSWGSTLASLFAINYPRMVAGMVLRGIFLAEQQEIDASYKTGKVIQAIFPEIWERFIGNVPEEARHDPLSFYFEKIYSGNFRERMHFAFEWTFYESAVSKLHPLTKEEIDEDIKKDPGCISESTICSYYMRNRCFLDDGWIINNAYRIPASVPVSIVQGRYDIVCPPASAYRLHKAILHSTLRWTMAGHSKSDPETQAALLQEVEELYKKI